MHLAVTVALPLAHTPLLFLVPVFLNQPFFGILCSLLLCFSPSLLPIYTGLGALLYWKSCNKQIGIIAPNVDEAGDASDLESLEINIGNSGND